MNTEITAALETTVRRLTKKQIRRGIRDRRPGTVYVEGYTMMPERFMIQYKGRTIPVSYIHADQVVSKLLFLDRKEYRNYRVVFPSGVYMDPQSFVLCYAAGVTV